MVVRKKLLIITLRSHNYVTVTGSLHLAAGKICRATVYYYFLLFVLFWEGNQSSPFLRHLQLANMKVAECGHGRYYYVITVRTCHVFGIVQVESPRTPAGKLVLFRRRCFVDIN